MKADEFELIVMHQTTIESLKIANGAGIFTYTADVRRRVINSILDRSCNAPVQSPENPQAPDPGAQGGQGVQLSSTDSKVSPDSKEEKKAQD